MQRLCKITVWSLAVLAQGLLTQAALAQTQFRLDVATQNASSTDFSREFGIVQGPYSAELQFVAEQIKISDQIQVDAGVVSTVYDWDNLDILDDRGDTQNFGDQESTAFQGILNATYSKGQLQVGAQSLVPINDTLIESRAFQASVRYSFRRDTLSLQASLADSAQKYPSGFYVDPLFQTRRVPEDYRQTTASLAYSQALNSKLKIGAQGWLTDHHEFRPWSYHLRAAAKYAVKSWAFFGLSGQYAADTHQDSLPQDGSGFYDWTALQGEVTIEPMYDLLLTGSYSWILEKENNATGTRESKLGADQVGFFAKYSFSQFTVNAGGTVLWHGTKARRSAIQGGMTWTL